MARKDEGGRGTVRRVNGDRLKWAFHGRCKIKRGIGERGGRGQIKPAVARDHDWRVGGGGLTLIGEFQCRGPARRNEDVGAVIGIEGGEAFLIGRFDSQQGE